jgi:hypothetical protein
VHLHRLFKLVLCVAWAAGGVAATAGETRRVVLGERYRAGALRSFLLGRDYRDLWTTPIDVPVLDLGTFAGGLTPLSSGGGRQTRRLTFKGGDGREYKFRTVEKDPLMALPNELRGDAAADLARDQMKSQFPAAALAAEALEDAAGIAYLPSQLFALPDDPRLGRFRGEFAGVVGLLEPSPEEKAPQSTPGLEDVSRVIESKKLFEKMQAEAARVDAAAYLRARLLDMVIGDWDRHHKQWNWAKRDADGVWTPIALDRDQAFSRYDGILLALARHVVPSLQMYGDHYGSVLALNSVGFDLDRFLLAGLELPAWEREVQELSRRLTDDVVEQAVNTLPPELVSRRGRFLVHAIEARRDALPKAARQYYRILARAVNVYTSDSAEEVEVTHTPDGCLVRVQIQGDAGPALFDRQFHAGET